jgi:hypothetical protein
MLPNTVSRKSIGITLPLAALGDAHLHSLALSARAGVHAVQVLQSGTMTPTAGQKERVGTDE